MAFATLEDVKRKLRIREADEDAERDGWLQDELDAADAWVEAIVGPDWLSTTGGTKIYYDVREDASILLPQVGCTVTEVRVVFAVDVVFVATDTTTLTTADYTIDDELRTLTLRPVLTEWVFENAYGVRWPRMYRQVEIDWDASPDDPPLALRDAVAILAAGQYTSNTRLAAGFTAEKMGDYSYAVRPVSGGFVSGAPMQGGSDYVEEAMRLLRPFINRRVEVI